MKSIIARKFSKYIGAFFAIVAMILIVYTGKVGAVRQHIEIAFTQLRRPLGSLFLKRGYANKAHILLNLHLFQTPVEG